MHRFFVPAELIKVGRELQLPDSEAEHIRGSLRLAAGTSVILFDGSSAYTAELTQVRNSGVRAKVTAMYDAAESQTPQIHLYQAVIRVPQLEFVLQKATELGVTAITPTECAYSQVHIPAHSQKFERWEKILREACKQAERTSVPRLQPITSVKEVISFPATAATLRLFCTLPRQTDMPVLPLLSEPIRAQLHSCNKIEILVGPEGGFSPEEHQLAATHGWQLVHLGDMILRSETAVIAALAFVHAGLSLA